MSARTCPDWPLLMELAPQLQFKHCTVAEASLPAETLVRAAGVSLDDVAVCCDAERHVYHAAHTDPQLAAALAGTHWLELAEWRALGNGAAG